MLILPLGHDKEILHFPYATVVIIAICLLVQLYSSCAGPDESKQQEVTFELQRLRSKIWVEHGQQWSEERYPDLMDKRPTSAGEMMRMVAQMQRAQREFFAEYDRGEIVDADDLDFMEYRRLAKKRTEVSGVFAWGYKPGHSLVTLITYIFIHGGWIHLIGNMLFLYLCGCNLEDRWGRPVWLLLYVVGGVAAALTWSAINRGTTIPLVGASGAIAAAMGAFLVVHHNASIEFFYFFWLLGPIRGTFTMKAYWALPLWGLQQLLGLWTEGLTAIAYSAHVGGFVLGILAALALKAMGTDRTLKQASEDKAVLYSQHPLFMQGLQQLQVGNTAAAETHFEQLLREKPDHLEAALELYRLKQDAQQASRVAGQAIVLARRAGDMDTPLTLYTDLNHRFDKPPLDDRSLFAVAECLERKNDRRAAATVYERLLDRHPDSVVAPRAMLNLAQVMTDSLSKHDEARALLDRVIERFGGSAFAERASEIQARIPEAAALESSTDLALGHWEESSQKDSRRRPAEDIPEDDSISIMSDDHAEGSSDDSSSR